MNDRAYASIDLKSFYASVECMERHLNPMTTHLVVADRSRTEKTICLAVSPALKAHGVPGRPRLFEVVERVKQINALRLLQAPGRAFTGASSDAMLLAVNPALSLDYIVAPPRMAHYMAYSARVYSIYLRYVAPEDIHVYSIDEVFIDLTKYLPLYRVTARQLVKKMILDVLKETGIPAAAGIGSNLYLAKVAMDIRAKHISSDGDGVRIAELDEYSYRRHLWAHRPLTDFWRVGKGYARKLEANGLYTMGDVARCSLGTENDRLNEHLLYRLFGVNAELLIDHAWGWEPCTIADIKAYRPSAHSVGSGQVLQSPYRFDKAKIVVKEMTEALVLDLVDQGMVTDQLALAVVYDVGNLAPGRQSQPYQGGVVVDMYGRSAPKPTHGSVRLNRPTASARSIQAAMDALFDRVADPSLTIRKLYVTFGHVLREESAQDAGDTEQLDLFTDYAQRERQRRQEQAILDRERRRQQAVLAIKKKFGKNAILKGISLQEGATARDRNGQIGGHKA